jgi:CheY-like chemotaxis protein
MPEVSPTAQSTHAETESVRDSRPDVRAWHVLVVEDVPSLQKLLATVLKKAGHSVTTAENGEQAVRLTAAEAFDVVLMDIQMPGMNGLDATRAIRARECETGLHLPIVAVTAHALLGDVQACRDAGVDEYLPKPINFVDLMSLLKRVTRSGDAPQN